jgi:hypothetical protein
MAVNQKMEVKFDEMRGRGKNEGKGEKRGGGNGRQKSKKG